jgi:hypothetical protein
MRILKNKIGCILWQLPPSMHFSEENVETLDKFLAEIEERKNVIEFRHKSWWNEETYLQVTNFPGFSLLFAPKLFHLLLKSGDFGDFRSEKRPRQNLI